MTLRHDIDGKSKECDKVRQTELVSEQRVHV